MTCTTTSITACADGTVDIGGNLFKLDALIESYSSILEQAKQQLESLDITEAQLDQITNRASRNIDYYRLSRAIPCELASSSDDDTIAALGRLADAVRDRVCTDYIRPLIRSELRSVVDERFSELVNHINARFEDLMQRENTNARVEARGSTRMFEELFRSVFGQEIKDHIKREANELAEDWQKQRAELDVEQAGEQQ
jgi:hypothetical protein